MTREYLNACGMARGRPGRCYLCDGELPKGRRRWCSDECAVAFEGSHYWNVARWLALKLAGHACRRCGKGSRDEANVKSVRRAHFYDGRDLVEYWPLEVNHRVPRNGRGYEPGCHHHQDNLEALCHDCHVQETRRQHYGRRLAVALRTMIRVRRGELVVVARRTPATARVEAASLPLWADLAS